jgi:hypothetical protein
MKYLYALLACMLPVALCAQISFSPEVGLNASNYRVKKDGKDVDTDFKLGGRIGLTVEKQISNSWYFQPSLLYVTNGYKGPFQAGHIIYIINTIELPLIMQYKFCRPGSSRYFIGAGPVVSITKDGVLRVVVGTINSRRDLGLGNSGAIDDIKIPDVGLRINGGYQHYTGVYAKIHAQWGFFNMLPGGNDDNYKKNYNFALSFGYFLGKHKNKVKEPKAKKEEIKAGENIEIIEDKQVK